MDKILKSLKDSLAARFMGVGGGAIIRGWGMCSTFQSF